MRIFIYSGNETRGPYSIPDAQRLLDAGIISLTDLASYNRGGVRLPLSSVLDVSDAVSTRPANIPTQDSESSQAPSRARLATANAWLSNLHGWIIAIALFLFLGISIYRNIQVSRGRYDEIRNGMTKAEIRAILGSPNDRTEMNISGVHAEQWVYSASTGSTSKIILVDFENGRVTDKTWGGSRY